MKTRDWNIFFGREGIAFPASVDASRCRVRENDFDPARWEITLETHAPEVLVTCWATPPLPQAWIESPDCPLKYLCHVTGSVRRLVPRAFLERGGRVTNWGTMAAREVAEHALRLALAALRKVPAWRHVQSIGEDPPATAQLRTGTLFGRRVGIHGFGNVARALVNLLRPFGTKIAAYSAGVPPELMRSHGVEPCSSLEQLFAHGQVLFECEALTPASRHCVNAALLARLPKDTVFVNVGRGEVVVEQDLVRAAQSGRLRLALDVMENEPFLPDDPLALLPGAILSPHIAGPTYDTFATCAQFALDNVERYLQGGLLEAELSLEDYDRST